MIFILLLITVLTLSCLWVKWRHSYWKRNGVSGPDPTFLFGNIKESTLLKDHFGLMCEKWYKQFTDVPYVGIYKMTEPAILLRDPDLVKDVLIKDFSSFEENDFPINKDRDKLLATNPFFTTGAAWKRNRALMLPPFAPNKIKMLIPAMESSCEKLISYIKSLPENEDIEAKSLASRFTTQNVIKCGFSIDAKSFEPKGSEFSECIKKMFEPTFLNGLKFLVTPAIPKWLLKYLPISMLDPHYENWFRNLIRENKASREATGLKGNDIMQFILEMQEKHDMTETEVVGHAISLFFDGAETSSNILSFVWYELARHPDYQQRAYEEICEVLEKHDNKLTWDTLQEMKYLESVIAETMRLNLVVLISPKICTKPYTLPKLPNQKEPFTIPVGTTVIVPYKAIHYDAKYYPNPEEFIPERFNDEERKKRHKALFLPFGEGPRMCLGMRFGLGQITVATVHILKNFTLTLSPNHKPFQHDVRSFMWLAKDGLILKFTPRDA